MLFIWNMASMLLVFNITCMVSPPSTIMGIAENFDLNLGERNLIFSVIGGTHYSILKVLIFFSSWFTHTHTPAIYCTPHHTFSSFQIFSYLILKTHISSRRSILLSFDQMYKYGRLRASNMPSSSAGACLCALVRTIPT